MRSMTVPRIAQAMAGHPLPPEAVDDLERAIAFTTGRTTGCASGPG
jgi:hypothetical protein